MREHTADSGHGQPLSVRDIKERLVQDHHPSTLLLWPPNLFAFTSYILHLSGAYQLVVSPPPGDENLYHWPPKVGLLEKISTRLSRLAAGDPNRAQSLRSLRSELRGELKFVRNLKSLNRARMRLADRAGEPNPETYLPWTFLVRKAALEWRASFDRLSDSECSQYLSQIPVMTKDEPPPAVANKIARFPALLRACWEVFSAITVLEAGGTSLPLGDLLCNDRAERSEEKLLEAWLGAICLLTMHAIADDACVGWGILGDRKMLLDFPAVAALKKLQKAPPDSPAAWDDALMKALRKHRRAQLGGSSAGRIAARKLAEDRTMATIASARARILPKRHNPDVGITMRSLSSNLAFHHSPIEVEWKRDDDSDLARKLSTDPKPASLARPPVTFTMLLLPFPKEVHTNDFSPVDGQEAHKALDNRGGYGFFRYFPAPSHKSNILDDIKIAITSAREEEATVDMIVLPECALSFEECNELSDHLAGEGPVSDGGKPVSVYIAGVREYAPALGRFDHNNLVRYGYREKSGEFYDGSQRKHHRWQLNKSQIEQYGLSRSLDVGTKWWEAINVERRQVSFINIGDAITLCPLICEDLARQDPIADLIRQVGPSLVVAILMDGPQHNDRWSSRYAAILSEDPGSAVLALTSFGMVRRWNTRFGRLSRVVALWKDKEDSREIELDAGATGILLTLRVESECEVIADGRLEMCPTSKIVLTGVNQVYPRSAPPPPDAQSLARSSASAASEKRL